ncbi:hypothetical protein [Mucilaginibacter aquaedulcis]|uniref:hypothetical protein n=1 Tax=Mucilaginibacter aquaedulcis TaxID=1187081 RepID=UPI0025B55755|nr:hypothetical protein [Mucilaginibacter aquaedulcis]MDN3550614.1 hypothetical protein [Mucilaginibacter aquaedulcis]
MALIKLAYRQIITASSAGEFEKKVFEATYQEFLLKSQTYNPFGKYKTFTELKAHDGRANSLHYKMSFAAGHFITMLDNYIPNLKDNLGKSIKFELPQFELIESAIDNLYVHQVAIIYTTGTLTLINQLGEFMILAEGDISKLTAASTFILKMQQNLSIVSYQETEEPDLKELNGIKYE